MSFLGIHVGDCISCLTDPHIRVNDPTCQKCLGKSGPAVGVGPDAIHHEQLSKILKDAGWSSADIPDAEGVVHAESSGQANAESSNPDGGTNVGLFQIDCKAWPQFDCKKLHNPPYNAQAAKTIHDQKGWSVWATYPGASSKYRGQDMSITWSGSNYNAPTDLGTVPGDVAGAVGGTADVLNNIVGALFNPSGWFRVSKGALGGVLVIIGVGAMTFVVANKVNGSTVGRAAATVAA